MKKRKKLAWFAACDDVRWDCTFDSQAEAWAAMKLTEDEQRKQKRVHAKGAYVWCEEQWAETNKESK